MRFRPSTLRICIFLLAAAVLFISCSPSKKAQKDDLKSQAQGRAETSVPSPRPKPSSDEQLAKTGTMVTRSFERDAIRIRYTADGSLNLYEEKSHAMTLVVYQLNGINEFNQVAKEAEGLVRLLRLERFGGSVLGINQFFIEPGETKILDIDRLENVKWVGIVAGYWNQIPGQTSRAYEMPILIEKKGHYGFRKTEATVTPLMLNLYLGPYSLQEVPDQ